MKSILALLLLALVSITTAYTPYKEFDPYSKEYVDNCTASTTTSWLSALQSNLNLVGLGDRLITGNTTLLNQYAEDYGHIYHRAPKAVYVPVSTLDVKALVNVLNALNAFTANKIQIVVRGGSGNVQGATQTTCGAQQVLLDTSLLNNVDITGKTLWAQPGASWLKVVQAAAAKKLRPTVVPDYLGLTIGGFYSIGGLGAASSQNGAGVDQVLEVEVVTPTGAIVLARSGSIYFEAVRGGMGVFGVMTRVKISLEKNTEYTRIYRVLTQNFNALTNTMKSIINNNMPPIDTVQSFAIPNDRGSIETFIAPAAELNAVNASVNNVLAAPQTWIYYIELGVRIKHLSVAPTKQELAAFLTPGIDSNLIFYADYSTPDWDNRLKLFTVPVLVAIGAWEAPHPWGAFNFPETSLPTFETVIQSYDPLLDAGFGLVALYPILTSSLDDDSFFSFPKTTQIGYHVTLGNTVAVPGTLERQLLNNRRIWNQFKAAGPASVYPSVAIPDFGPADWAYHFGAKWSEFLATKKALDPNFIFADQRNFGFASLY